LDLPAFPKKIDFTWSNLFAIFLVAFILFGLGTKLVMSISMDINTDVAGEGLEAMEIWKHQNYLLGGFYLPSQDTFIFTELLPFQFIPQVLTGYSPLALKAVIFIEFALGMAVLSYVVYVVSGDYLCALLFAALATNLPPTGYQFFSTPTSHTGTIFFLGLILALLLYIGKKENERTKKTKKGKNVRAASIPWTYVIVLIVLVILTAISDTIIITWLIFPYILAYVIFAKEKSRTMGIAIASMAAVSALAYVFKTYFVYNWVVQTIVSGRGASDIILTILPIFTRDLTILLNPGLYSVARGLTGFGILEALSLIIFVALVLYAARGAMADKQKRLFYGILLASALTMFVLYLITQYSMVNGSARYMTFEALAVFMLIAVSFRRDNKIYMGLALVLLLISAAYGYTNLVEYGGRSPNVQEYGLISYLKENNLTFGYSSYWNSNIITYLSGEDVTIRAVFFYRDSMRPEVWLACERWYQSTPDRSFILVDNSTIDDNGREVIKALTAKLNASEPLRYGKFDIYPIEGYHIPPFMVQR